LEYTIKEAFLQRYLNADFMHDAKKVLNGFQ